MRIDVGMENPLLALHDRCREWVVLRDGVDEGDFGVLIEASLRFYHDVGRVDAGLFGEFQTHIRQLLIFLSPLLEVFNIVLETQNGLVGFIFGFCGRSRVLGLPYHYKLNILQIGSLRISGQGATISDMVFESGMQLFLYGN